MPLWFNCVQLHKDPVYLALGLENVHIEGERVLSYIRSLWNGWFRYIKWFLVYDVVSMLFLVKSKKGIVNFIASSHSHLAGKNIKYSMFWITAWQY